MRQLQFSPSALLSSPIASRLETFRFYQTRINIHIFIAMLLALTGCATSTQVVEPVAKTTPLPQIKITQDKSFDSETLYSLLVAEMAINRRRMDIAFSNYAQQAEKTSDLAVTERATRLALAINDRQASLQLAKQWTQLDPSSTEARYVMISEYINAGQYNKAFDESYRLLEAGEMAGFYAIATQVIDDQTSNQSAIDNSDANTSDTNTSDTSPSKTDLTALIDMYSQAVDSYPHTEELLTGYSALLQANKQLQSALDAAEKASNIKPTEIRALFQKSRVLLAMERTTEAEQVFAQMVKQHPANKRLRLRYANMLVRSDMPKALEQYILLAKQEPDDSNILLTVALIQQEQKLINQAKQSFQQLLDNEQHLDEANFGLAEIAEQENQTDLALSHYKAVNGGERFMSAVSSAADIIFKRHGLDASHQFLSSKRDGANQEQQESLYILEADTLSRSGLTERAAAVYEQGLKQYPGNVRLLYSRALDYANANKIELAEQDFRAVLQQIPNHSAALNAYGYTLANSTTRLTEAKELITKAYTLNNKEPAILDSMGWVEYKLGNFSSALTFLQEAMNATSDHEIAAHLGEVLWKMNRQDEAISAWKQGLEDNPDSHIIKETLMRLRVEIE